jgi:hypothetical protein
VQGIKLRATLLLAGLISLPALGYEFTGKDWTWQANPVDVPFDLNLSSWTVTGLDVFEIAPAFANAATAWSENASGARVTAKPGGNTTSLDLDLDYVHITRYVDGTGPGATVATTSVWSYTNGSGPGFNPWDVADCDAEFYASNDLGDIEWSADANGPASTEMDLELVAIHELGHCLGLDHTTEIDAVMYESVPSGTPVSWRELHQDDLDGIDAIYGDPPLLDLDASLSSDSDGDGLIEAGESCTLEVVITDIHQVGTTGVGLELLDWPPELSFDDTIFDLGDLGASGPGISELVQNLDFDVDSGCTQSGDFEIDYQLTDDQGRVWSSLTGTALPISIQLDCSPPPLQLPELQFVSLTYYESIGDGDAYFEPGETIFYTVYIENTGDKDALAVSADIYASSLYIINITEPVDVGDVPFGTQTSFDFEFDVSTGCFGSHSATLDIMLNDTTNGLNWKFDLPAELVCSAPELQFISFAIDEASGGDGDGLIEEGERITYTLFIENIGDATAEGVKVEEITTQDADILLATPTPISVGDVQSGALENFEFMIAIDPGCVGSRSTEIEIKVACTSGAPCPLPITLPVDLDCSGTTGGLVLGSSSFTDDDGDGRIEQGETIEYAIDVSNLDAVDYQGVSASISSTHTDIRVTASIVQLGDIAANGGTVLDLQFEIDDNCTANGVYTLNILLKDNSGNEWQHAFPVELECSAIGALVIDSVLVDDANGVGNGDGVLQEGETDVRIEIALENTSTAEVALPIGYIITYDSNIVPANAPLTWPTLSGNDIFSCEDCGYLDVYDDCTGTEAQFELQIYDENFILSHSEYFTLPIDCDEDDDGSPASLDCDDLDATSYPGATELCDGIDNDCNTFIDDGIINKDTWYADADGDGYGDMDNSTEACVAPVGYVGDASDCDDTDAAISPAAVEVCDNLDNNCTGFADDGLLLYSFYADTDGDGFGDPNTSVDDCAAEAGYVADNTDCDDTQYSVAPNRSELCDGLDNDCDGDLDEDCEADADGDGWGESLDCDDADSAINPDAEELCDGVDNNCDGLIDNDASDGSTYYTDADGDGYGDALDEVVACTEPAGTVSSAGDCDDTDSSIYPGAIELCNGVDEDCDGLIDDNCQTDDDGDGYSSLVDCNDYDSSVNPGATEVCDGIDNDCDTIIDDDATNLQLSYLDADGDGFGTGATEALGCEIPPGYVDNNLDCDDSTANRSPDNAELCDGIDNNCDLLTDNDAVDAPTWFLDNDGDGFGDPNNTINHCELQQGMVSNDLDCDDTLSSVYPQAPEIWYDGVDQDCDGIDDDRDQDGYLNAEDCDDNNSAIFPGSGHFDADCEPISSQTEPKTPTPRGGGGCATPLPASLYLWWLSLAISLRRRRRQAHP